MSNGCKETCSVEYVSLMVYHSYYKDLMVWKKLFKSSRFVFSVVHHMVVRIFLPEVCHCCSSSSIHCLASQYLFSLSKKNIVVVSYVCGYFVHLSLNIVLRTIRSPNSKRRGERDIWAVSSRWRNEHIWKKKNRYNGEYKSVD